MIQTLIILAICRAFTKKPSNFITLATLIYNSFFIFVIKMKSEAYFW